MSASVEEAPPLTAGATPPRGAGAPWPRLIQRSLGYGSVRIGLALTAAVVLLALVGPFFAPHDPAELVAPPFSSGADTVLGTDYLGQDVLSRVLWGGRAVVWMAFSAATLGVVVGALIGLAAGYSRGIVAGVVMRGADVLLALPYIVLVLLFVAMLGSSLWMIVGLVALVWVPQVARVARAVTSEIVEREFVQAAEAIGLPRRHILIREVLPNLYTPLMIEYGLRLTWSIGSVATIAFLGFGIQPPDADWGRMINENRAGLAVQPWGVVAPVICIAVFTIGSNLIAEGIARAAARIDTKVDT
jgi:peptide/nickel transport system permease protein